MGTNSSIEWCDDTLNLWWGCDKIRSNPCCDNCYAETWDKFRGGAVPHWGAKAPRLLIKSAWQSLEKFNKLGEQEGRKRRVFTMSMGDIFERERPLVDRQNNPLDMTTDHPRQRLFEGITNGRYPWLDFLMLTKRLPNVLRMVPATWLADWPTNVWLGTSVGDKANLSQLDLLRQIPAAVRFVSMEPLLEDLGEINLDGIHWVIGGGESGANARPMPPNAARSLRDQCQAAGVKFFFKQWGEWAPFNETVQMHEASKEIGWVHADGRYWRVSANEVLSVCDFEKSEMVMKVGKYVSGRLLDGREWNEFPQV